MIIPSGHSTADQVGKLTGEVKRKISRASRHVARRIRRYSTTDFGRGALTFVQLANRVFDVLAQQAPLFRCHMAIAATLIEIRGNCSTHHGV